LGHQIPGESRNNSPKVSGSGNVGITPMELDRTEVRKFQGSKRNANKTARKINKKEFKQNRLCFRCGQKGHIAKMCPSNSNKTNPTPGTSSGSNTNVKQ
ncbi:18640_t:CDS:1, partial [Racocetra fulgida]